MMDPASKICGASKDVNQEDRISNLPSCLIGHILSLLPTTEDAVATSVLSKQWKNHWTLISRLEFDDFKVRLLEFHGSPSGAKPKRTFTNFVYHILQCRSLRITSFRIECYQSYDASHVISWVSMVLRMTNIRELDISVPLEKPVMHPWNLFICDTLVKINLGRYFVIDVLASVNLPCLKVLSLDYVKLLDNDSISRLLGGCPVLEELSLGRCIGEQVEVVNIFVPSLTSLNLTYLRYDRVSRIKIVLKTPKLSYLVIDDNVVHCYEMKDANNLSQAKIEFSIWEDVDEIQRESLHGLLKAISKVKSLEFGDNIMQAILSCKFELPEFHNVVELKFGYPNVHTTAKMLPTLLKLMPCLTSLTLDQGFGYDGSYNERRVTFAPLEDVPDCLVLCLKKFEIRKFKGSNNEQTMLEYILKNAKVLEKLVICDLYDSGIDMPRASSIISQIPRASPICKIELLQ